MIKLTDEHRALIPAHNAKHIALGMNTDEADWETAERAVRRMLELSIFKDGGIPKDYPILRAGGLLEACLMHAEVEQFRCPPYQAASCGAFVARNEFMVEILGFELEAAIEEKRVVLSNFARSCGGAIFGNKITVIYDRPSRLKILQVGNNGVLHSEDGPALAWGRGSDGKYSADSQSHYALYFWQGTRVPRHWIMDKVSIEDGEKAQKRAAEVLQHPNQEVMRAGCEIIGWVPVLEMLGMRVLDEDPNPMIGKLVEVDLPAAPATKFLVAECGTGRTIALLVDPESTTALDAGARSYGVPVDVYAKLKVRT